MKKTLSFLHLFVCVVATSALGFEPDKAVIYKTIGDVELKLHVFQPEGHRPADQRPAIVFFFGGSWSSGAPTQFYQQARELADLGFVAMSAEYRVAKRNKTTPFDAVADAKSAVRWIRQHAEAMGIHPGKIVASGGSAGGHLAVCTALIQGGEQDGEDHAVSSVPDAVVAFNPVLDTTARGFGLKRVGKDRQFEVSPCHQVQPGLVPMLVLHGTADKTVPFENAQRFARQMQEAGNRCELLSFEGEGHGFFNSAFFRPKIKDTVLYDQGMSATVAFLASLGYVVEPDG